MSDREISEIEEILEVTELIGLGETQRKLYEILEKKNQLTGDILNAYHHHEQGLQSLIKYQKTLASA